jgi:signal peptidase I
MIKKKHKTRIKDWLKAILIALLILWMFNLFFIQSFTISNSNMENTLFSGDKVVVNKIRYGITLPATLLSIPLIDSKLPFTGIKSYLDWISIPYFRILRFFNIQRNDVLIINNPFEEDLPVDKKTRSAVRCIGIPGDTILILNKKVFVNNKMLRSNGNMKYKYRIVIKGKEIPPEIIDKYNLKNGGMISDGIYDFFISSSTVDSIIKNTFIKNIKLLGIYKGDANYYIFPHNPDYGWNDDYYGPVIVPKKNTIINIDRKNFELYRRIIEKYEKNTFEIKGNSILINKKIVKEYKFKLNYYFVLDDNRDNSFDSREWGFLPEDHIIGSASFVWLSINDSPDSKSHFRWNRFFKIID